jgi:dipeptidyl aminopeptidase/acylaminoacyl peptidase
MAFKDWGFFPRVGEQLALLGFASITFNFSMNGVNGNGSKITETDRFAANTFSRELGDLGTVIGAVEGKRLGSGMIDHRNIALLGHSRGGGIAIIRAAIDTRIAALVTWSAVSRFDRWTEHQKKSWRSNGSLPLSRDTSASPLRLGLELLDDLESHRAGLSVVDAAARIGIPWLILHGGADVMVPVREAETLYAASSRPTTELVLLERVGHLYNAASQAGDSYKTLDGIIQRTADWLHHHLTT